MLRLTGFHNLLRPDYLAVVLAGAAMAVLLKGGASLYEEWRSGYTALYQTTEPVNLPALGLASLGDEIKQKLAPDHTPGLPAVRLYIPEKARAALMRDLPAHTKDWQEALMLYPDGDLKRIQVRHRGDNPINWAYAKKSWRIKTRKKALIERARSFNYVSPQEKNYVENHLAYVLGRELGLLSPRTRLVELWINDRSQGVYVEVEDLDESFLRESGSMPIDLYKGEQYNAERWLMVDPDLFNNSALWSKVATFNQTPTEDLSNLSAFLETIRRAETSSEAFSQLRETATFEIWGRFSAYQTLIQSWHNDNLHNMRLAFDPWRGTVAPVILDTATEFDQDALRILDAGSHPLLTLYNKSSHFLLNKHRTLLDWVRQGVLRRAADQVRALQPAFQRTFNRDGFKSQQVHLLGYDPGLATASGMDQEWRRLVAAIGDQESWLRKQLTGIPDARWHEERGLLSLQIQGSIPVGTLVFHLPEGARPPSELAWDRDGDGRLSPSDPRIPFTVRGSTLQISAVWYANRVSGVEATKQMDISMGNFAITPTTFRLVADIPLRPVAAGMENALTGEAAELPRERRFGQTPSSLNVPVIEPPVSPAKVWSGDMEIEATQVIRHPVVVEAGTTLRLRRGVSLIFRDRVDVRGTAEFPVTVTAAVPSEPWGTLALQGPKSSGSTFTHLDISRGSGGTVAGIHYTSGLAVHDTKNVRFDHLRIHDNSKYDDMMHVIYGQGIHIDNSSFEDAVADGLDVDISEIRVSHSAFRRSGNDALDLMTSQVVIEDSDLESSGDKAISVGESARVVVFNTRIARNVIGIEVKDGSVTEVVNSDFVNNEKQLHAYAKNWRYGEGGRIEVHKSTFSGAENAIAAAKQSRIRLHDSSVVPLGRFDKRVELEPDVDESSGTRARHPDLPQKIADRLAAAGLRADPTIRGRLP